MMNELGVGTNSEIEYRDRFPKHSAEMNDDIRNERRYSLTPIPMQQYG
ncbi:hypothetical protein OsccyDRAFT_2932 [Leptolyngbyaceae cyanobacterium JSC-12]|nr:hypothetical protein OsccyDRAFT_2932 [Leptolyngbyaceae cyanobacterium JSC-12]